MLVAALDTATLALSCALVELGPGRAERIADRTEHTVAKAAAAASTVRGHSARLPGALQDLLVATDHRLADVEGYAIGIGPGSFTGLRIGLATWKGLAYASRRPIAGASSLAAMALAAAADAAPGTLLVPLLDAKKGEVYAGFYRVSGEGVEAVLPEAALPPGALAARLATLPAGGPGAVGFGEGYAAHRGALEASLPPLSTGVVAPPAFAIARLAAPRLLGAAFDLQALFALEPHYVRASEAEVKFPKGFAPG
jgi:tRNA threonylcarbamoyladenosine biosynthesis protein TsaB